MKRFTSLKVGVAPIALGIAMLGSPALAQDEEVGIDCASDPTAAGCADEASTGDVIVVTGSILRSRVNQEGASPLSVIQADNLETRGVTTIDEAIQNLASNGAGTLPNSFTAQGAFAAGASAASLRGLTTSSTLVLFDGLRAAYYPLADDGTRNFVDLNTIPDAIVDRVEVLKDGASSTYGADAIGGVVNVITKKEVTGLHLGAEAGISERGDYGQRSFEATYGIGDVASDGFNVYVSGRYYKSDELRNNQLPAPFNGDYRGLCKDDGSDCLGQSNGLIVNGREFDGSFYGVSSLQSPFLSREYDATGTPLGGYEQLNPNIDCQAGPRVNLTAAEQAANAGFYDSPYACEFNLFGTYGTAIPRSERINGAMRATVALSDNIEGYVQFNYARSDVSYEFYGASAIRSSAPAETGITFNISPLFLPVYICPGATYDASGDPTNNGCDATNGTLNPNNPYAANGNVARILGNLYDIPESARYKTDAFRGAFGVSGYFGDSWTFDVSGVAMKVDLERTLGGRVYIANFLQAVADGSYNFVDPSQNSQSVRDFVAPTVISRSNSEMYQLQATLARDLMELPGGPLQVGVGASWRHERVNAPGADSDGTLDPTLVNPLQRYTSRVNPFGSIGKRDVYSVFGEINAPIVDMLNVNLSGRYDDYSTGQNYFSPKIGVEFSPIQQIKLRGTYSKGFRIGSFAEFGASPTTGYITGTGTVPQAVQDAYAAVGSDYITNYSLGLTQAGNPNLQPEKSESYTFGIVAEPIRNVSFTVDYWRIKKTDLITGADYTPALAAYYAGQPIPDGFTVIPDTPSTDAGTAGLIPRVAFVQYSFTNKDSGIAEGIDFAASASFELTDSITWRTNLEASYLLELSQTVDGAKQEYQGSIGPYVITSAAGSPQWRGSWQNTLDFGGKAYLSATAYYTDSYSTTAEDITGAGSKGDCDNTLSAHYLNSGDAYQCSVDSFVTVNLSAGFNVTDDFTVYFNVNNLFDKAPPIDTATYGAVGYNPAWHTAGILGRYFKAGIKATF
ncbi:TonB-dependent receptor plug domain-containing protein [Altererythrobacter sp.]|uniref:TonB-dependent receptor plug domain-containing protein n=1 Tax=Altererythrobacter sp. TaxID=1872480 RepID=UPI003D105F21